MNTSKEIRVIQHVTCIGQRRFRVSDWARTHGPPYTGWMQQQGDSWSIWYFRGNFPQRHITVGYATATRLSSDHVGQLHVHVL